jgi:citrate/tricarballylate utilization protein
MQICNACRYCEGFCAVFPAMTRRLEFGKADMHYLANLCHNCGACLHACQYAPPHEFAVNVPQAMAQVRGQTYADYAWPPALGALYATQRPDRGAGAGRRAGAVPAAGGWPQRQPDRYCRLAATSMRCSRTTCWWACLRRCLCLWCWRWPWACAFWREVSPPPPVAASPPAAPEAVGNVLRAALPGRRPWRGLPQRRRRAGPMRAPAHHLTFYGFMLCFAATSVATLYHYAFGWVAPYDLPSLPKAAGRVGRHQPARGHGRAVLAEPASAIPCTAMPPRSRWTGASSRCCSSPA